VTVPGEFFKAGMRDCGKKEGAHDGDGAWHIDFPGKRR